MGNEKIIYEGITFDDILLLPAKSNVLPRETNLETKLTKNIKLNIPFLSAAMDTVTTSNMAIAMAVQGGLGIIHKNMSIEDQADEIHRSRSPGMSGQLNPLPGFEFGENVLAHFPGLYPQLLNLVLHIHAANRG